ncbi:RNA polymerase recycling motor HelD [Paenibacillus sp. NPDC058071]|uniref:RNA polymerase recycling motor HelD n=1 Tax=Paenibacillus sp. NPDC058071 TaxID=3346326 RepID=UPI0036DF1A2D
MQEEQRLEQQRVDRVTALIRKQIDHLQDKTGVVRQEIVDIRRNFWDDVTVNFEDAAEAAETAASMKQQAEVLLEREHAHGRAEQQLKVLIKLEQSPYFGRMDFIPDTADSDGRAEHIYLGVGSLLDETGSHYLIYDWRAPVSSLYYDYPPGPAEYTTPGGSIEGEMTLKRQYVIRRGVIASMFDTGVTIGDELLQEVLGQQSDAQMKTIVATIQREQNQIIRNERARLLIVQGAAGSGKTSAALQRVAYLLYRYRDTLNADQIVLFSPNPMFNSYVSTVLPELGEQNMQQTTYQQYVEHRLGESFALEDPFVQMEYTLGALDDPDYEAKIASIRYKSGVPFMEAVQSYAKSLGESGLKFKPIRFRGRTIVPAERTSEYFYSLHDSLSIPNRMRMTSEWLLKELTRLGKEERSKKWVQDEMELLDKEAYIHAYNELQRKNKFTEDSFDDFRHEQEMLSAMIVQERFKRLRSRVKKMKYIDMPAIYRALFTDAGLLARLTEDDVPADWNRICELTEERLNRGEMGYEDATPYLYLAESLEGFHTNTSVRHLFIDEAQDYSAFQFHYLKRIFPMAKMTVLGDLNQSIFAHSADGRGFEPLSGLFSPEETEKIVLHRSYRSTRQIVEFTSDMVENGAEIIPFNRNGEEPTVERAGNKEELLLLIKAKLDELRSRGVPSIALIGKTAEESKALFDALKTAYADLRLIEKETVTFEKGTVVIPSYLAKGVEFDAVVISDASAASYGKESERRLFYTVCTRAMHELHLFYCGEPTMFLTERRPARSGG